MLKEYNDFILDLIDQAYNCGYGNGLTDEYAEGKDVLINDILRSDGYCRFFPGSRGENTWTDEQRAQASRLADEIQEMGLCHNGTNMASNDVEFIIDVLRACAKGDS